MKRITITPAYGKDYRGAKSAEEAFRAGKDFIVADMMDQYYGKPCNIHDLKTCEYSTVNIRYKRLTRVCVVKIKREDVCQNI